MKNEFTYKIDAKKHIWNGQNRMMLDIACEGITRSWLLPSFPLSRGRACADELLEDVQYFAGRVEEGREEKSVRKLTFSLDRSKARLEVEIEQWRGGRMLRLHYRLLGTDFFAGRDGRDRICYGGMACRGEEITEIQLSQFDRITHSYVPAVRTDTAEAFEGSEAIGPILIEQDEEGIVLLAYEHGAQAPDHFLEWVFRNDDLFLESAKGNYYGGQPAEEYAAPWIEIGFSDTKENMLRAYRSFILEDMNVWGASRKPYIFYNTWHVQEGNKYLRGDSYLKPLSDAFILKDIEIAHRMGIEVYVIDTGWFQKTGDWEVNERFFPGDLSRVRKKLKEYGMQLGLWFNPIAAARTSHMYEAHPECVMSWKGEEIFWGKIWETEESYGMCLASDYSDMFIEQLVQLNRKLGVTYFKWDAVGQYGCDSPRHRHGTAQNDPQERADAYAYRMGLEMIRIAGEVSRRCPGAIVDFDMTEGGRFMGLGFLSAGKYFLMNNGPYFHNFDIPSSVKMDPDTINVFFYPGAARSQICRQGTRFDSFIPSVLFLTHFFPHGNANSQENAMASLALGGNGIWGYLQDMTEEDIARWAGFLEKYKLVRENVTRACPIRHGDIGASPEIHEKIDPETGKGMVVFFTHGAGCSTCVTQPLKVLPGKIEGADAFEVLEGGRLRVQVQLDADEARVVFLTGESRENPCV